MNIVLASTSPRRRKLIKKITEEYTASSADIDEKAVEDAVFLSHREDSMPHIAEMTVRALSRAKALAVFDAIGRPEDTLVIGADTVVCLSGEILGKPKDREDAVRMLRAQSKEPQQVFTGVTLIGKGCFENGSCPAGRAQGCACCCGDPDRCGVSGLASDGPSQHIQTVSRTFTEKTTVYFFPLDEAQEARIQSYCDTDEPYDKAGAYGIQDNGNFLVDRYEGDFDNIVGFPTERIRKEIESFKYLIFK